MPPDRTDIDRRPPGADAEVHVVSPLAPEAINERLLAMAKRGQLPGFRPGGGGGLFSVAIHGVPFDKVLVAWAHPAAEGTRLVLRARLCRTLPALFAVLTVLAVWPGVWLTDSMLRTYFTGYRFQTWMWYIPLTVLPLPFAVRGMIRRTRHTTGESIGKALEAIVPAVQGVVEAPARTAA